MPFPKMYLYERNVSGVIDTTAVVILKEWKWGGNVCVCVNE